MQKNSISDVQQGFKDTSLNEQIRKISSFFLAVNLSRKRQMMWHLRLTYFDQCSFLKFYSKIVNLRGIFMPRWAKVLLQSTQNYLFLADISPASALETSQKFTLPAFLNEASLESDLLRNIFTTINRKKVEIIEKWYFVNSAHYKMLFVEINKTDR